MSGWIKFSKDMANDPRLLSSATQLVTRYIVAHKGPGGAGTDLSNAELLDFWCNALRGALVTLWCYADEHIRDDDSLPLTAGALDAIVRIDGFFDVISRDWVDELDDGSVVLPGYCLKNSLIAKRKRTVQSNERVTRWRQRNKPNGNGVTNGHVTHQSFAGDLDLDLDLDQEKNLEKRPRKRDPTATRLPADFELTAERRKFGESKGIDPDEQFAQFRDHWQASADPKKAVKRDWDSAWRNWCRQAVNFSRGPPKRSMSASDRITWRPTD